MYLYTEKISYSEYFIIEIKATIDIEK